MGAEYRCELGFVLIELTVWKDGTDKKTGNHNQLELLIKIRSRILWQSRRGMSNYVLDW